LYKKGNQISDYVCSVMTEHWKMTLYKSFTSTPSVRDKYSWENPTGKSWWYVTCILLNFTIAKNKPSITGEINAVGTENWGN